MKAQPISIEQVMVAAEGEQLGALLESLPIDEESMLRRKPIRTLHRFDYGLVAPAKEGPMTLPYRDLRIYRASTHYGSSGVTNDITTQWTFQRGDGEVWRHTVLLNRKDKGERPLAGLLRQAIEATCTQQRDDVHRRLAEGATLSFGPVDVNLTEIRMGVSRTAALWREVESFTVQKGMLLIQEFQTGRWAMPVRLKTRVGEIPNLPLLCDVIGAAIARARAQS